MLGMLIVAIIQVLAVALCRADIKRAKERVEVRRSAPMAPRNASIRIGLLARFLDTQNLKYQCPPKTKVKIARYFTNAYSQGDKYRVGISESSGDTKQLTFLLPANVSIDQFLTQRVPQIPSHRTIKHLIQNTECMFYGECESLAKRRISIAELECLFHENLSIENDILTLDSDSTEMAPLELSVVANIAHVYLSCSMEQLMQNAAQVSAKNEISCIDDWGTVLDGMLSEPVGRPIEWTRLLQLLTSSFSKAVSDEADKLFYQQVLFESAEDASIKKKMFVTIYAPLCKKTESLRDYVKFIVSTRKITASDPAQLFIALCAELNSYENACAYDSQLRRMSAQERRITAIELDAKVNQLLGAARTINFSKTLNTFPAYSLQKHFYIYDNNTIVFPNLPVAAHYSSDLSRITAYLTWRCAQLQQPFVAENVTSAIFLVLQQLYDYGDYGTHAQLTSSNVENTRAATSANSHTIATRTQQDATFITQEITESTAENNAPKSRHDQNNCNPPKSGAAKGKADEPCPNEHQTINKPASCHKESTSHVQTRAQYGQKSHKLLFVYCLMASLLLLGVCGWAIATTVKSFRSAAK